MRVQHSSELRNQIIAREEKALQERSKAASSDYASTAVKIQKESAPGTGGALDMDSEDLTVDSKVASATADGTGGGTGGTGGTSGGLDRSVGVSNKVIGNARVCHALLR